MFVLFDVFLQAANLGENTKNENVLLKMSISEMRLEIKNLKSEIEEMKLESQEKQVIFFYDDKWLTFEL